MERKDSQEAGHNQQGLGDLGTVRGLNITDLGVDQDLGVLETVGTCSSQWAWLAAGRPECCG